MYKLHLKKKPSMFFMFIKNIMMDRYTVLHAESNTDNYSTVNLMSTIGGAVRKNYGRFYQAVKKMQTSKQYPVA